MATDTKALLARHEKLKSGFVTYQPMMQELADYLLPRKREIMRIVAKGTKQTDRIFDATAIRGSEILASSLHANLTSAAAKWFKMKLRQTELNEIDQVQDWLDECGKRMYAAKQQSNFAQEFHEVYLDLVVFGTGALLQEERQRTAPSFGGLLYKSLAVGSYVVDENAEGRVDTLMRSFELNSRAAVKRWGKDKVGPNILETYEKGDMDRLFTFVHAVYPREDARPKTNPRARDLPYASCYVHQDTAHLVNESGFHEFPFMVPRWSKSSGEIYGRGPGHTALPFVKTLNKAVELKLKAWAKVIDPPLLSRDDGVIGSIKLSPGGVTVVRDLENSIKPLESAARFDVQAIQEQDIRAAILSIFLVDELALPPTKQTPELTATEVQIRWEIMQRLLGPTLGRLEHELLNADIERTFGLMMRGGALPPPPPELLQGGAEIDIEYEGPLARAQRMEEVIAMDRLYTFGAVIGERKPEIWDVIDDDKAFRIRAEVLGVPASVIRDPQQVAAARQARAEEQEEQAEMDRTLATSEAIRNVAPALKTIMPQTPQTPGGGQVA